MDWPISWNDVKEKLENAGGGLPMVELTSDALMSAAQSPGEWYELSESEIPSNINDVFAQKMPIILRVVANGEPMESYVVRCKYDGYHCDMDEMVVELNSYTNVGTGWGIKVTMPA